MNFTYCWKNIQFACLIAPHFQQTELNFVRTVIIKIHVTDIVVVFHTQEADGRRFPWNISTYFTMHCENVNSQYFIICKVVMIKKISIPIHLIFYLWLYDIWIHFHRERYRHNSSSTWSEGTQGSRGTFTLVLNHRIT